MRLLPAIGTFGALLSGCDQFSDKAAPDNPQTRAEVAAGYNYVPLDPLPVEVLQDTNCAGKPLPILARLPDNAVRIAVRQLTGKANVGVGPAQVGAEGNSYQVILDYINTDVKNLRFKYDGGDPSKGEAPKSLVRLNKQDQNQDRVGPNEIVVPVYIGIGLRLTANVKVLKGQVNLSSLGALAAAAEAQQITGSLVVQTLGITGKQVTSSLPLPSELNPTTIQNAIQALGAVKAVVYDESNTVVTPRVTGIYNPFPTDNPQTINLIVSGLAGDPIPWWRWCPS